MNCLSKRITLSGDLFTPPLTGDMLCIVEDADILEGVCPWCKGGQLVRKRQSAPFEPAQPVTCDLCGGTGRFDYTVQGVTINSE